ncbi:uncharacterized BCR [Onion yellows phytoplasma OY-M]|uniref:Uncharacterized BCR n=1 Tax=Onion yellows phytoplasma (strain OY-M) TaxID=262768 RepID=Q6YPW0_ONYPE|nr:uncharacterized BCR [Onion yellows phytoplasma OY-M]
MKTQSNMFEKLKKMQEAIENAQKQLELQEFIGKAGDVEIVFTRHQTSRRCYYFSNSQQSNSPRKCFVGF